MKKRIIFATGNENKMKEIRMILKDVGLEILSMKEAGVDAIITNYPDRITRWLDE